MKKVYFQNLKIKIKIFFSKFIHFLITSYLHEYFNLNLFRLGVSIQFEQLLRISQIFLAMVSVVPPISII